MKKVCENDGVEFEAKRKTARFCSDKCRVEAARAAGADPSTGEVVESPQGSGLENKQAVTLPEGVDPVMTSQVGGITQKSKPKGQDLTLAIRAKRLGISYEEAERRIKGFEKMGLDRVTFISTGIPELDAFQQIPRGRITQIQGPFAVGKTTLALNMIRGLADKRVFYIDSEASLNPDLLFDLGLNDKNFTLWNKTSYIEDIYEEAIAAADSGRYEMIIIDSLAACTTKVEESGTATDRNIGQKALIVNKLCRIIPMKLKDTNTALVIINQERDVIGSYVPQKYTPGGSGPLYHASLILALKTIPSWCFPKDAKDGAFLGHEIQVTILKSKVSRPHRKTKIKLNYVTEAFIKDYQPEETKPGELSDAKAF